MKDEQTLVIIKPDGVQRSLIGEVISRFERVGLKLTAMKLMLPTEEMVAKHYTLDPAWKKSVGEKSIKSYKEKNLPPPSEDPLVIGESVLKTLQKYLTSGPVVCMVWQGAHAVKIVRKLAGNTEPLSSDVGTIRGDFVLDSYPLSDTTGRAVRNVVHASGSVSEAEAEMAHWFSREEVLNYRLVQEQILYDVNLDGSPE